LARRIPLELPILTSFARTTTTPRRRTHIIATTATSAHSHALANAKISGGQELMPKEGPLVPVRCMLMFGVSDQSL
jgi:hypothetical protein